MVRLSRAHVLGCARFCSVVFGCVRLVIHELLRALQIYEVIIHIYYRILFMKNELKRGKSENEVQETLKSK